MKPFSLKVEMQTSKKNYIKNSRKLSTKRLSGRPHRLRGGADGAGSSPNLDAIYCVSAPISPPVFPSLSTALANKATKYQKNNLEKKNFKKTQASLGS